MCVCIYRPPMPLAQAKRATGMTNANEHSSRSHCVLTVSLCGESAAAGIATRAKLHLIDLAGCERLARSGATGARRDEAVAINKSLSALGDTIAALSNKDAHIPYRNSKLTYLLSAPPPPLPSVWMYLCP